MPVRLFISDIDGCLSEPYEPYDLERFVALAGLARAAEGMPGRPRFSLCSGRPFSYVEAMSQVLGLRAPVLFESGGGMFDPVAAQAAWSPAFTDDLAAQLDEVRSWFERDVLPGTGLRYDYGKRTQAGIIGPDRPEVARWVPRVERFVEERFPGLVVFHTPVSIDVVARAITKREAMHWLADVAGTDLAEIAYIGDTNGDLGALEEVGYSFAPANADPAVRAAVDVVTRGAVTDGVLEAYRWCLAHNAEASPQPSGGAHESRVQSR